MMMQSFIDRLCDEAVRMQKRINPHGLTMRPAQVKEKNGRNEPCPCGSGKKYKHCCGKEHIDEHF